MIIIIPINIYNDKILLVMFSYLPCVRAQPHPLLGHTKSHTRDSFPSPVKWDRITTFMCVLHDALGH